MRYLEQELKLKLDEREYGILSALTSQQPQLQINYYFTSLHLPQDTMVRVRKKGERYLLCCKERLQQNAGVTVCTERECEISAAFAESLLSRGIMQHEINDMLKTDFYEVLTCVGKMETYRTAFDYMDWHLELDKNVYFDITDYELECENENMQELLKLKNFLVYQFGIVLKDSCSKSQRFFEAKNAKV